MIISDEWAPVLDVVPDGFLFNPDNTIWTALSHLAYSCA